MPKHTIEFNLPQETEELNITLKASNYYNALYDISQKLRNMDKYEDNEFAREFRKIFYQIIKDNEIEDIL